MAAAYRQTAEYRKRHAAEQRAWRARNPEKSRASVKAARQKRVLREPEVVREQSRKYAAQARQREGERGKKRHREWMARWRAENPEASRELGRQWRIRNRDKVTARLNERRMRLKGVPNSLSAAEEIAIRQSATRCYYCKKPFGKRRPASLDHITPITRGGAHVRENVVMACRTCNTRKHATHFDPITQQGILL